MGINSKSRIVQKAFITNSGGDFLILKRSQNGKRPGEWDLAGGALDDGESLEEGLHREIREETAITDEYLSDIEVIYTHSTLRKATDGSTYNYILLLYKAASSTESVVVSSEHSDYKWVHVHDLQRYITHPLQREAVETVLDFYFK